MKTQDNSYYHIYNRGNNKENIFFEDENYRYFLRQFAKYLNQSCEVYAYCLMPNHFHFFIKVIDKMNFDKGIKNFFISYSKSINKTYGRVGSLFQGRFKAIEIDSDSYFTRIVTYIHQNPLTAGLVEKLEEYPYSSYRTYISEKKTLINRLEVISWFGGMKEFIANRANFTNTYEVLKTS
ncbi:MAG: transposase [Flavobacteriales bacterium]|nr:MAG: transposase [Flavobacteriales bacterium]